MGQMMYSFSAVSQAPSVGMLEVHKYPRRPWKKSQGLPERGHSDKSLFTALGQQTTAITWDIS